MSTLAANQGQFQPVHSAHSIEQAMFVLQFDRALSSEQFGAVRGVTEQFKNELPGEGLIQGLPVVFGGPMMQFPIAPHQMPISGVILNRTAPDGSIENELRVEQVSMSFRTTRYSRWAQIWGSAQRYFGAVLGAYLDSGAKLVNISLNVVDKFVWHGDVKNCDVGMLLRTDCEYVPTHIFTRRDLWHFHTGAFERVDHQTKRLINVNFDCLDEIVGHGPRRVVSMATVLTDMFGQPGFEPITISSSNGLDFISRHMSLLHALDKEILRKAIVESMAQQIALNG